MADLKFPIAESAQVAVRPSRNWTSRRLRYFFLRLVRMRGTPAEIARGVAIGVFAGMYPFFGLQTILSVAIATVLRGNRLAAAASTWISNPFTYLPIYAFNFQVGHWVLQSDVSFKFTRQSLHRVLQQSTGLAVVMVVGCTVVGGVFAAIAYCLTLPLVRYSRRQLRLGRRRS